MPFCNECKKEYNYKTKYLADGTHLHDNEPEVNTGSRGPGIYADHTTKHKSSNRAWEKLKKDHPRSQTINWKQFE